MKYRLLLLFLTGLLSSCNQPATYINDNDLAKPLFKGIIGRSNDLMGSEMLRNTEILSIATRDTQPAIVFLVNNSNLDLYLKTRNLSRNDFSNNKNLSKFLKSHVIAQEFLGDGTYTTASGDVWKIEGKIREQPTAVNGISVSSCDTSRNSDQSINSSFVCYIDKPIVDLQ